jgi:F-type H+-transporting ATPase subunit c
MRPANLLMIALFVLLGTASPLLAAEGAATGAGLGMGLAIIGISIGLGLIGYAALTGIARQPEQAGAIQGVMFILAGLVEGAGILALVLCLALMFV